jgi:hypothetical protein
MEKDNIVSELKTALNVALLKHKDMNSVASNEGKMVYAFGILIVAALISGLGLKFFGGFFSPSWWMVLSMAVYQVISAIIGIYILSIVAKAIFKGHAKHNAFFRVMAYGMIVTWLAIFPPLSIIGGIWAIVIVFVALKVVHKLTTGGAIGSMLVTIIAMILVSLVLTPLMAALGLGGFGYGTMQFKGSGFDGMMDFDRGDDGFEMKMDTEEGEGSMRMEDGKMTIEGPDGEVMEITIPDFN